MILAFPVLNRELRMLLRTVKAFSFLLILLIVTGLVMIVAWAQISITLSYGDRSMLARVGFMAIIGALLLILGLISPLLTATAITSEREARTLELLFCSGISRLQIVFGKWLSAIAYQLLLCVYTLPVFALLFHLGGVALGDIASGFAILLMAIATYGMLGLACSAIFRHSIPAIVCTLALVLFFSFGLVSIMQVLSVPPAFNSFGMRSNWPKILLVSPVFTMGQFLIVGANNILLRNHLAFQAALFLASTLIAWKGLARRETLRPVIAKPVIHNQQVLEQRRNRWPYYLIDPLARAQQIRDNQNPVFVKEVRVGALSKIQVLIRMGYVGLLVSISIVLQALLDDNESGFNALGFWTLSLIILFIPILSSSLISRERQEGTMALLTQKLLTPGQIVRAKFLMTLRYIGVLAASLLLLPMIFYAELSYARHSYQSTFVAFLNVIWAMVVCAVFYSALGLFCSSQRKSNAAALVYNYGLIALLMCGGSLISIFWKIVDLLHAQGIHLFLVPKRQTLEFIGTIFNPYLWFTTPPLPTNNLLLAQAIMLVLSILLLASSASAIRKQSLT